MIYRIYCLKNQNEKIVYVGQTQRELQARLNQHKTTHINRKDYTIHLLEETNDLNKANELETFYIIKYNTVENGENITYGKGTLGLGANPTSFQENNTFGYLGTKKVKCIETGTVYNSLTECANELELNISKISAVCRGKRKSTGNLHFEYVL